MSHIRAESVIVETAEDIRTIKFLKEQKYLKYKNIKLFLKNNFNIELPYGFNLLDQSNNIIGFLGTMYSYRFINKQKLLYCNLHTWIVNEEQRLNFFLNSKEILSKIFNHKCIFFAKPAKSLVRLFLRDFKMKVLEMKYRTTFLLKISNLFKKSAYKINDNPTIVKKNLNGKNSKIFEDHKKLKCKKFIIFEKKNSLNEIFIVASKKRKKFFFHTIELNYCSDIESLKKIWPQVSLVIAKKYKVCFCSQYFLKENHCAIPKELKLLNDSKYEVVVKDLPESLTFDTLYSELVY